MICDKTNCNTHVGVVASAWLFIMFNLYLTGTRYSDGDGSSNEVQRTMLELINQLDGFDPRGNIKVLMATNRYTCRCHRVVACDLL